MVRDPTELVSQLGEPRHIIPAVAVPVEHKDASYFECPAEHRELLGDLLPEIDRLIVVGWRDTEDHFLDLWKGCPTSKEVSGQVISGTEAGAATACERLMGIGLHGSLTPIVGGFTNYLRDRKLDSFLFPATR